jgi:hypothetical protein
MNTLKLILMTFILFGHSIFGQSQKELYDASIKAYESKDYKAFLKYTVSLDSIRPFHPTYSYNLVSAHALNSNWEEAQIALRKLILMNSSVEFENDINFKAMENDEGYSILLQLKKAQNKKVETSKLVVTLSEKDLHPEGLLYLTKSKVWLASSVRKRKIVSFDSKTGLCVDWLKENKMLSVLAIKADAKEQFLWAATTAFTEMEGFDTKLKGKAEVLKIDIKTKKIVKRFSIEGNPIFGDLVIAKNGIVYISNSNKPVLYKIENNVLSEFISFEDQAYNLQGLTFNADQSKMFLADYLKGICMVDINSKNASWLEFPDMASPKGIDGLVFYNNSLVAIQNGVKPIRVTQLQLNDQQNQIIDFKIVDNNRAEFNEPTLATKVGDKLYFFSNSPWNEYDEKGVLDLNKVANPMLYSLKP